MPGKVQTDPARPHGAVLLSLQMTEGRHCQVHLLDDRNLELLVQVQTPLFWAPYFSLFFLAVQLEAEV